MLGEREHDDDGTGGGAGRRVLLAPVDMDINQAIPEAVWQAFDTLPSQTLPRKAGAPGTEIGGTRPGTVARRSEGRCTPRTLIRSSSPSSTAC